MAIGADKQVPILLILIAATIGYVGYSGTGLDAVGLRGVQQTQDSIVARQKSIDSLVAMTDSAKRLWSRAHDIMGFDDSE